MKIAFAHWENRIAPVFDTAGQVYLIDVESGHILTESKETLAVSLPVRKVLRLVELGVDTLICGAISRPMYQMVIACGIQVVPFVAGDLHEVIQGWLRGNLDSDTYNMPGCGRRGGLRFRLMQEEREEEFRMNQSGRGGRGYGGQKPGHPGRMGGQKTAGPIGDCVCPQCGEMEPHQRGVPCSERKCSKCGTNMARK